MKPLKLMSLIIVLLGLISVSSVWARGGHHHGHHHRGWGGFGLGLGLGYGLGYGGYGGYGYRGYRGYGWGYPRYRFGYGGYYPPVVAVPSTPPVYIQQQGINQSATESQNDYWYYCRKPEGYYPHVKKCSEGWMQVVPHSPTQ